MPEATAATAATAAAARAARGADVEMCKDGSSGSRTSIVPVLPQLGGKGAGDGQKMDEGMNFEATAITAPAKRPRGRPRKDGGRRVEERASKKSSDLETGIIRMAHVAAAAAAVATVAASVEDEESEEEEEEVRRRALGSK